MFSEKNGKEQGLKYLIFEKEQDAFTQPKSGENEGQDEGIQMDKGMYASAAEERKMTPAEMGPGSVGTRGESRCGQRLVGMALEIRPGQRAAILLCVWLFFFFTRGVPRARALEWGPVRI